ncbi:hypothetical protein [uncultured Dialister sp.]|uniref:hypothetical protein n=1 Tax=uncultured Dialister sp. TaxID=278064 RepID=UPI002045A77B|nr:hypothetical protein [uncultured Dialister sp.]DAV65428.1 MAG TPA: malate dehydrogenase, NAD-dependent [Caudoviricetes sp.]
MTGKKIYIGPSLSGARLIHATVFSGGYTQPVRELIKENPWLERLFVPVGQYTEKMRELSTKGTALNIYAKRCREV